MEAEEQSFDQKPTQAVNQLMEFMKGLGPPCRGLVPTTLRNVCASQHSPLAVRMSTGAIRNGDKALCLVATQGKSTATALENDIFRVVTDDVMDLADSDTGKVDFTLTGLCTKDGLADFKIDAPRGGKKLQAALVIVSSVAEKTAQTQKTLYLEAVQLISAEDVENVKRCVVKLITHAESMDVASSKRAAPDPKKFLEQPKKCRRLSACPTDASL